MSDMTQIRQHQVKQAWLHQQRPSDLIDAGRGCEFETHYPQPLRRQIVLDRPIATGNSFVTGSSGYVMLVDANYPTGGPAFVSELDLTERLKAEGVSPEASSWIRWVETTKGLLLQRHDTRSKPTATALAIVRVDRLTRIQAVLGLPVQVIAEILGVTRQGLYKWLDATKDITLQETSRQRLDAVEKFSGVWRERATGPIGALVHERLAGGLTVLNLLTAATLDDAAIVSALDELAAKLQAKPKSLSQRMADAGFKRKASARSLPSDEE